jgi:hypothetical protein
MDRYKCIKGYVLLVGMLDSLVFKKGEWYNGTCDKSENIHTLYLDNRNILTLSNFFTQEHFRSEAEVRETTINKILKDG